MAAPSSSCRSPWDVEILICSAHDLKNINWRNGHQLRAYAVAWVDPEVKVRTTIDESGGKDPEWEDTFTLALSKPLEDEILTIQVYHDESSNLSKPLVGRMQWPLREMMQAGSLDNMQGYSMNLLRPSGRPQGTLEIRARLKPAQGQLYAPAAGYGQHKYPSGGPLGQVDGHVAASYDSDDYDDFGLSSHDVLDEEDWSD